MLLWALNRRVARRVVLGGVVPRLKASVTGVLEPCSDSETVGDQHMAEAPDGMDAAAPEDGEVIVRIDGEDAGRFAGLEAARTRTLQDGAWTYAMAHLEFVDEDSGVVLERWSKRDYPEPPVVR